MHILPPARPQEQHPKKCGCPSFRLHRYVQRSTYLAEHRGLKVADEEVFGAAPAIVEVGLAHFGRVLPSATVPRQLKRTRD